MPRRNASSIDTSPRHDAPNRVKTVTKQQNGGMTVELGDGVKFDLKSEDIELQVWVVWTMLANS